MAWGLSGDVLSHRLIYSRELLLDISSLAASNPIPPIPHFLRSSSTNSLPGGMLPKNRRRKKGRRGGVQRRLRTNGLDNRRRLPPLPTILLSNVQSLRNKLDELEACAKFKRDYRDACLLAFTETWLKASDSNEDLHISGFGYPVRMDRSPVIKNKSCGGGVCFYINKRYCNSFTVREEICTPDLELLSISLRPFYLPREFPQLFFTIVYIHPQANTSAATQLIEEVTNRLDSLSPDAPTFILGDCNHCQVHNTLKTYEQYVTCPTTLNKSTIDLCYGTVPGAFKSLTMPPFGASYHTSVLLVPIYKPICRKQVCTKKTEMLDRGKHCHLTGMFGLHGLGCVL